MQNYIRQGALQIEYFKSQSYKYQDNAERFKKKLQDAENIIEEQNRMINTFETI